MKPTKFATALGFLLAMAMVLFFYSVVAAIWVGLITWGGWWVTIAATLMGGGFAIWVTNRSKTREQKWVPTDAHDMARGLVTKWQFTLEEGWEVVELMEAILKAEHDEATAWQWVRILRMRMEKDQVLATLRRIAGHEYPTTFPRILNTRKDPNSHSA